VSRKILAILFIFMISSGSPVHTAHGAGPAAEVSADKAAVYIGDRIRYTITVRTKPGEEVEFPQAKKELGVFKVKDSGVSMTRDDRALEVKHSQWYILASYKTGQETIPALEVKYRAKGASGWVVLKTKELSIQVKSLLAENPKASDIRDIKNILPIENRTVANALKFILLFIAIVALIILIRRIFFGGKDRGPKAAHIIAYEELEGIKMSALLAEGNFREYYFRLSNCIRRYLENRFSLRAPEMTTEEFLNAVKDSGVLEAKNKGLLKDFLLGADMVKFAKYGPARQEAEASYEFARRFIDETKEKDNVTSEKRR